MGPTTRARAAKKRAPSQEDEAEAKKPKATKARAAKKRAASPEKAAAKKRAKSPEKALADLRAEYKLLDLASSQKKKSKKKKKKKGAAKARVKEEEQLKAKISDSQEEHPALRGFCDLNHNGAIGNVVGFLDPVSLFHWGSAIDSYCVPPTKESQTLVEALEGHLLERTMLPSAGYTLASGIFQDPNQIGVGEDQKKVDRATFRHRGVRGDDPRCDSNAFYDELDQDQKQQRHLQWYRKVRMTKEESYGRNFDWPPHCNPLFHLAYGYRGRIDEGYPEIDEANQDSNMRELGAFAGNSNFSLYQLFGTLLTRAECCSRDADRRCILLEDILHAAEAFNIKHTFPVETGHTICLLDGRTLAPTLQEIASLDPEFKELEVGTDAPDQDNGWGQTAVWEISLLSHEEQVAKAQENIQNHIKKAGEMVEDMEGVVELEKESIGCDGDNWGDEEGGDEEASAWLVAVDSDRARFQSKQKADDRLLKQEALSRQERIKPQLESFATNDIPSFQPHSKPALIGDRLKILKACHMALCHTRSTSTLISPSASMFLQQLIEDFGLGMAIQPLPVTHERLPMPALCGVVLGRNGTTMAQLRVEGQGDWGYNDNGDNDDETSDQSDSDFSDFSDSDSEDSDSEEE